MVNLDKLLFLRFFWGIRHFTKTNTVSYCTVIQTPWGPWPRLGETPFSDARPRSKLYFPKKIAAIDSSRIEKQKQCHHHCVPLNMDHPQLGLSVFGAVWWFGMLGVEMSGTDFCNVCRKNTGKKQQHFFATKRVIMKNPARFFHFALDKVRLLSNFQVILSETGSIFGGSGALVVAAGAVVGFQRPIGVFDGLASPQNRTRCKFCWQYRWHFCPKKAKL